MKPGNSLGHLIFAQSAGRDGAVAGQRRVSGSARRNVTAVWNHRLIAKISRVLMQRNRFRRHRQEYGNHRRQRPRDIAELLRTKPCLAPEVGFA